MIHGHRGRGKEKMNASQEHPGINKGARLDIQPGPFPCNPETARDRSGYSLTWQ